MTCKAKYGDESVYFDLSDVEATNAPGGRSAGGRVASAAPAPGAGLAAERFTSFSAAGRSRETSSDDANGLERVSDGTTKFSSVGSSDTPTPPGRAARLLLAILRRARRSRRPALASGGSMPPLRARALVCWDAVQKTS